MSDFWVQDGETMLLIGDSITDCGRRAAEAPLGNGYVRAFTEIVTAQFPERNINYINRGIGGNRVTHLHERWREDVIDHAPDKLSIKIGINDLHSHLRQAEDAVPPARFEELYDAILDTTQREIGMPDCADYAVLYFHRYIRTDIPERGYGVDSGVYRHCGEDERKVRDKAVAVARSLSDAFEI